MSLHVPTSQRKPLRPAVEDNKLRREDRAAHDWYRFVLSFPPHLVRHYLAKFDVGARDSVLDPFCGTGTTLVECKKMGIASVGIEPNPVPHFASRVKTTWDVDPDKLVEQAKRAAGAASAQLKRDGIDDTTGLPLFKTNGQREPELLTVSPEEMSLLLKDSISPVPLHKTLVLLRAIQGHVSSDFTEHALLALAKTIVFSASNLHFGPEVGVGPPKADAPVITQWLTEVSSIATDIRMLRPRAAAPAAVFQADARDLSSVLSPKSIDAVITSPPYPNEKDYTRTTRLETVLLGFIRTKSELRELKQGLVRSNTRNVYKSDEDHLHVAANREIEVIAEAIETRRLELGKTSGWERLYPRVTRLYFGGMARHLAGLREVLRPGAQLAYVVGDQASYLRVMIRTGRLLADIAKSLGYEVTAIDLFRTRLATATKEQLREEVVLLRWPG
jgi:hypothetical protein